MVVTRRTPAAPVPTSRNPSSQPIPRVAKKPNPDTPNVPGKPSPLSNGSTLDSSNRANDAEVDKAAGAESKSAKSKGKQKAKKGGKVRRVSQVSVGFTDGLPKKKSKRSTGFMEFVFRLFLLWFTIYTLAVCPEDLSLQSPVCRGLAQYRALVIEPYILPPIEHALSHPSVAPYVAKVKPYVDHAVRTAKPVAARIHKEFNARVVPQWNKRVVPLYHMYAVPQLVKLDAQTAPYRARVEKEYEQYLAPYVRRTAFTVYQLQEQARPYVVLAAQKTYQGYQVARPYVRPMWEKTKVVLAQLAAVVGEQRRQFVDPHVQKIWEHVKEMSSGKPLASQLTKAASQVSQGSAKVSPTLSSISSSAISGSSAISSSASLTASSVASEATSSSQAQTTGSAKSAVAEASAKASSAVSSASSALKSSASVVSESLSATLHSVSATKDTVVPPAASLAEDALSTGHGSVDSASFVAEQIPPVASSLVESSTTAAHDAASEAVSSVLSSAASAASDTFVGSSNVVSTTAESASTANPSAAETTEDDDLDFLSDPDLAAFKAELGLSEEDLLSESPSDKDSAPAEPHVETEEEREARLEAAREKTARDRAALVGRHAKWEAQLEEEIRAKKKALRKTLVAIRKAAVTELKGNEEIRNEVDSLIEDGEKFLRGAEKYLANLRKESRKIEEKRTIWDRIVGKVDEKFTDRLHQTEAVVNGWYKNVVDNELAEVDKLATGIKDLAERAQADIGLDYAYLDDVSYQDWQRYHDLVRRSENFTAHAHSVQDGSHPSPPINPVTDAIKELQDEVDDVIAGFNARLRKIKRSGARVFGAPVPADEEEQNESASILPIEDSEQSETPVEGRIRNVVVGRGKGEVEAALNRAAEADAQKTSSPGTPEDVVDTDTIAQSLSDELASEETSDAAAPVHQEL